MSTRQITITLTVDGATDSISGVVASEGDQQVFHGWIALIQAIDAFTATEVAA